MNKISLYSIMLTNIDIKSICNNYDIPLISVCMKDELPKSCKNGNYIINLESSVDKNGELQDGSHWTMLIVKDKIAYFQDSFGALPSQEIIDFVKRKKGCKLYYNNWIIQDLHSDYCGYFCIGLLLFLKKYLQKDLIKTSNSYVDMFVDDTKQNDKILQDFFKSSVSKPYPKLINRILKTK